MRKSAMKEEEKKEGEYIPEIRDVCYSRAEKYLNQFITSEADGMVRLWEVSERGKKRRIKPKAQCQIGKGSLEACHIEPKEGKLIAVGGLDTDVYVYAINPDTKKKEEVN